MAWDNPNELVIGGTGEVLVAPVGTALPADFSTLSAATWSGLGYTDEDGVTFSADPQITEIRAWQSRQPVRRSLTGQDVSVAFKLIQWNEMTVPLAFGGGAVTLLSAGVYQYKLPDGVAALDERAMVIDVIDGSNKIRIVLPRGNVKETVSADFRRTESAQLPITFGALAPATDPNGSPGYLLFNAAQFAVGS